MRISNSLCLTLAAAAAPAHMTPDPKLRVNHDTYSPVVEVVRAERTPVTDDQLAELKKFPVESIWAALQNLGSGSNFHAGLKSTRPQDRIAGRARTMRYLPLRPGLDTAMRTLAREGDWPAAYNVRAAEEAKPGDVLVVDLGGDIASGIFCSQWVSIRGQPRKSESSGTFPLVWPTAPCCPVKHRFPLNKELEKQCQEKGKKE